jgi:hypothetical protein
MVTLIPASGIDKILAFKLGLNAYHHKLTSQGKENISDVGRVLYTLEEAAQYGWCKPEPLVVEFESEVFFRGGSISCGYYIGLPNKLSKFEGKRVKVRVEEILE